MVWGKIGSTTLTANAEDIDITTTHNIFSTVLASHIKNTGNIAPALTFNDDTSSVYVRRYSTDGGSDTTATEPNLFTDTVGTGTQWFNVTFIANTASKEKLVINNMCYDHAGGVKRQQMVGKWVNTSSAITKISWDRANSAGTFASGTNVTALGSDLTPAPAVPAIPALLPSLQSPSVGGWKEVGRTTLGSAGDNIDISSLPNKRYYMVLTSDIADGTIDARFRLGNGSVDTGSNYARRGSENGASDVTGTGNDSLLIPYAENGNTHFFGVHYIANKSDKEKLLTGHCVDEYVSGAGNAPARFENAGKWANTSDVIDVIRNYNAQSGSFDTGSEMVVLGFDPTDTHTTNFWEQLASVTLGTDGDVLSSGTFTAKKYLWVQAFIKNSGTSARYNTEMTFNGDTGSNYSERRSLDGSSDATSVNQTKIMNSGVTGSNDDLWCLNMFVVNNSATEKLCIGHGFDTYAGSGAGTAPSQRFEKVAKWANTSSQITNITITNSDTSNYDAISELRVWGSD